MFSEFTNWLLKVKGVRSLEDLENCQLLEFAFEFLERNYTMKRKLRLKEDEDSVQLREGVEL